MSWPYGCYSSWRGNAYGANSSVSLWTFVACDISWHNLSALAVTRLPPPSRISRTLCSACNAARLGKWVLALLTLDCAWLNLEYLLTKIGKSTFLVTYLAQAFGTSRKKQGYCAGNTKKSCITGIASRRLLHAAFYILKFHLAPSLSFSHSRCAYSRTFQGHRVVMAVSVPAQTANATKAAQEKARSAASEPQTPW